jgi:hypothetical protein
VTARACDFVPFPGNGAYGHWKCGRRRWHLGHHRFINYTVPRIPQFWRVAQLRRDFKYSRRSVRMARAVGLSRKVVHPYPYRQTLFPATYKPIPDQGVAS